MHPIDEKVLAFRFCLQDHDYLPIFLLPYNGHLHCLLQ